MRKNIESVVESACRRDMSMPNACRYHAAEVTEAIQGLVPYLEEKGISDTLINRAVGCLARILPKYALNEGKLGKAVEEYAAAIGKIPASNLASFFADERTHAEDYVDMSPVGIKSRSFLYLEVDRSDFYKGRINFPEKASFDRCGEEMDPEQERAYRILEDSLS